MSRIKILEAHDISVGEAIDLLFEARDKASSIINEIDENIAKNASKEESSEDGKTYDEAIQDYKHHVSWAKDFFKI